MASVQSPPSAQILTALPGRQPNFMEMAKVGFTIFVSTTPGLGETVSLAATAVGLVWLALTMQPAARSSIMLLLFVFALILPITIYDLMWSLDEGWVTASFLAIPILLFSGFMLARSSQEVSYLDIYERVIFYLAAGSFFLYLIFLLRPDIAYSLPEYEYRETTHRTALLLNVIMNPAPVLRNAGFASEPGFYQIFINIALYARLQRIGRTDRVCLFYLLVVLSTLSTTGIAVSVFLVTLKFDIRYRLLLLVFIALFFGSAQELILSQYEGKIANDAVFGPRFYPSVNAFYVFLDRPLGIGAYEYTLSYFQLDIGSWDSFTQVALRYGVPGLIGFTALMVSLSRRYGALTGVLIISFLTSPIWFLPAIAALYFPSKTEEDTRRKLQAARNRAPQPLFDDLPPR